MCRERASVTRKVILLSEMRMLALQSKGALAAVTILAELAFKLAAEDMQKNTRSSVGLSLDSIVCWAPRVNTRVAWSC